MNDTTNKPLVSILIPTWQGEAWLEQTLTSVFAQDYRPLEVIVSDDGSTDRTLDILRQYPVTDDIPLQLFSNPDPGMVNNWNHCIERASGTFLKFVFQDDLIEPGCVSALVAAVADPAIALVYCPRRLQLSNDAATNAHCRAIRDSGQNLHQGWSRLAPVMDGLDYLDDPAFFDGNTNKIGEPSAVLLRRTALQQLGGFDPNFHHMIDIEMWTRLMAHFRIAFVDTPLAVFRIHPDQESVRNIERGNINNDMLYFCRKLLVDPLYTPAPPAFRERAFAVVDKFLQHARNESEQFRSQRDRGRQYTQELEQLHAEHQIRLKTSQSELQNERAITTALRHDLELIYNSSSWKFTRPLRLLSRIRQVLHTEGLAGLWRRLRQRLFRKSPRPHAASTQLPQAEALRPLQFTAVDKPLVTIVIPVHNKYEYTFHCLQAILENSGNLAYDIVVVDDCSSDGTADMLATIDNITVLRNDSNVGFIHSCNRGAEAATGEYLLLLNNDTEPQPGWLAALLQTFSDFPDTGMVGAKLLFPDGTLQEAGGIVWRDGSAWNFGRNDDPNKPEYSYARRADYCSGACLLLPRSDFLALGMFDTHYAPAYYEDTDLAFKVRAAGKQLYYQPLAHVIHFEGISNGTNTSNGIKEYQVQNQKKFFARWEESLRRHRPSGRMPWFEKDRDIDKRVLVVDARVLMPDHDSGSLRMFNLLRIFQRLGYKVTFAPDNLQYDPKYTPLLQSVGIECLYLPYVNSLAEYLEFANTQFQMVLLSRADTAEKHIDTVRRCCPQARVLYDTVDLHFLRERRLAQLSGDRLQKEAAELRRLQELGIARKSHRTLVVSPVELELFRKEAPDVPVSLLSNIHSTAGRQQEWAQREDILFIGSFEHPPNVDAVHWFIDEILPRLHRLNPDLRVKIVGGNAPKSLLAKASPLVSFTGFVANIKPLFDNIRLSIAPLRYGAGVKGKINSSMSHGVPVVATTIAAEGMGLVDGEDVLIADTPEDFANAIMRAYDDQALWSRLSDAGLANVARCFSFEVAEAQLRAILD